jgi:osomolarity two-component system response regulator SKN7
MNDVLPKPFTKEGLLAMLEKHLSYIKKPVDHQPDGMVAPQPLLTTRQVLKEEESPAKSPATGSNWNSPNQITGVSPVNSSVTDEYMQAVANSGVYGPGGQMQGAVQYNTSPQQMQQMQARQQQQAAGHRRQISEISGADDMNHPAKRQQMYGQPQLQPQQQPHPQPHPHGMNPMQQRPR